MQYLDINEAKVLSLGVILPVCPLINQVLYEKTKTQRMSSTLKKAIKSKFEVVCSFASVVLLTGSVA